MLMTLLLFKAMHYCILTVWGKYMRKIEKPAKEQLNLTYSFIVVRAAARYLASNLQEELRWLAAWSLRICICPTFMM